MREVWLVEYISCHDYVGSVVFATEAQANAEAQRYNKLLPEDRKKKDGAFVCESKLYEEGELPDADV